MDSKGLGYVKPLGLGCVRDPSTCCTSVWHLNSSAWAYVCWNGCLATVCWEVNCMLGRLRAMRVASRCSHGSSRGEGEGAVASDDLHSLQRKARMPAIVMVSGGKLPQSVNSRRGGTVQQHELQWDKKLWTIHQNTHCIGLLKQDMTHASFPYASPWQVIRQSHHLCSTEVNDARIQMHLYIQ